MLLSTIWFSGWKPPSLMPLEKTMVVNRRHMAKRPESKWHGVHLVPTRQIALDELVSSSYGSTRLLFSNFLHSGSTTSTEQKVSWSKYGFKCVIFTFDHGIQPPCGGNLLVFRTSKMRMDGAMWEDSNFLLCTNHQISDCNSKTFI